VFFQCLGGAMEQFLPFSTITTSPPSFNDLLDKYHFWTFLFLKIRVAFNFR
jgi:hypothetical protein